VNLTSITESVPGTLHHWRFTNSALRTMELFLENMKIIVK